MWQAFKEAYGIRAFENAKGLGKSDSGELQTANFSHTV